MKPLVICIDRDDDIGRKTSIKGPIIGRGPNLEAAQKLALADPADTDVNALYGAIKLATELETEVVTITGQEHVGIKSDKEVARQLEEVLIKLKPESIVFVSDGLDDEQVMPIIQSRVKVDSVITITVRQSKELEKAYFKMANFIKEVTGDPALARLIFGLPGIALVLLAIGGIQALSWIMGVAGIYLLFKGFGLEESFFSAAGDFFKSLSVERVSTILYVLFVVIAVYGLFDLQRTTPSFTDANTMLDTLALFLRNSNAVNFLLLALVVFFFARVMDEWAIKKFIHVRRYLIMIGFTVFLKFVLDVVAAMMATEGYSIGQFLTYGLAGVLSLGFWIRLTKLFFKPEIERIEKIMKETEGKEVRDSDGRSLGKVTKSIVENMKLKELRVEKRAYPLKDIVSIGEAIVVKKLQETPSTFAPQLTETIRQLKFSPPQSFPRLADFNYRRQKKK
jgi:putative membrane protein